MRTTLDIDDEVLQAAKELARQQNLTAGKVLSNLARQALTGYDDGDSSVAEPSGSYGFRPFAPRGGVVTNDDVEHIRDEESI